MKKDIIAGGINGLLQAPVSTPATPQENNMHQYTPRISGEIGVYRVLGQEKEKRRYK